MIATMLELNRKDCQAAGLKDAYSVHKLVYSLFPAIDGGERDFLFADKGGDANLRRILIISQRKPIAPQYGRISTKTINDDFLKFDAYGFEIILNPTLRDAKTGKIVAVRGRENLINWFIKKTSDTGFVVDEQSLQVNHAGVQSFKKNGAVYTHNTATFIGKLKVTDQKKFITSFQKGIGRAKGFGFGLLQIVPVSANIT